MNDIKPPFTEHYAFTGPHVAISCVVDWSKEHEEWRATSSTGFIGTSRESADAAALACFSAWMTGTRGWYQETDAE